MEWQSREARRTLRIVYAGATTPEELETLFEDAIVLGDGDDLCGLFADGGVLAPPWGSPEVRGRDALARAAAELLARGETYLGGARRVLQARDTALITTAGAIHVARRSTDGAWRMAIALLHPNPTDPREDA